MVATSSPVILTWPLVGRSRVPISCSKVVLPDPDGPTIPTSSPWPMVRFTPRRAGTEGVMSTVMVGVVLPDEQVSVPGAAELEFDLPDPEVDGQVASAPTEETTPGVVLLLGRVMFTVSPTATSVCCEATNATCTIRVV